MQEEENVEEGLEAIPTLNFPEKIDEEDLVDALSLIDDALDDDADFEHVNNADEGGSSGGGGGGSIVGGRGSGIIILKEESEEKPKIVRIPLIAERRSWSPQPVIPASEKTSKPKTSLGFELPRFFQTSVTPGNAKFYGDDDVDAKGVEASTSRLAPPLSRTERSTPSPFSIAAAQPTQNTAIPRSRRVPTLPSLPPSTPKEKKPLFGDLFGGGKNKSENHESNNTSESSGGDALDKMKTKISSALNNVKYGWTIKTKTDFRTDTAIWLLGELYHPALDLSNSNAVDRNSNTTEEDAKASTRKILDMFKSVSKTYRVCDAERKSKLPAGFLSVHYYSTNS